MPVILHETKNTLSLFGCSGESCEKDDVCSEYIVMMKSCHRTETTHFAFLDVNDKILLYTVIPLSDGREPYRSVW